jgi:iron complex outermembrane receptor protein
MKIVPLTPRLLSLLLVGLWSIPLIQADPITLSDVTVLGTRREVDSLDVAASVDRVDGAALRAGPGINLSESLGSVAGLSAQNRQNYAQDLQLSIRGFGARSSFGARGIRLYADGVPATMPDGQGQYSHFDLSGADHLEVLRGPFSALYGNASGGVIAIYTGDAPPGGLTDATAEFGSFQTQRYALRVGSASDSVNYVFDAAHFNTDGYRDHSRAERTTANSKVHVQLAAHTRLTLVANAIATPEIQDPLGLTANQLASNPTQAGTGALLYNTRKSLSQEQIGATLESDLGDADRLTAMTYAGHRQTRQFQAILKSVELASSTHPGGVIDLGRDYRGGEIRLADQRLLAGAPLLTTGGVSFDVLEEARRGYLNFDAAGLGDLGTLRRDEGNRVQSLDEYLQVEWRPAPRLNLTAGLRHTDVSIVSHDHVVPGNITSLQYGATTPIAAVNYRLTPNTGLYASLGRGFETPTLNDLAYRSTNGSIRGLNTALHPARSQNFETGFKFMRGSTRMTVAAFYIRTNDELAVKANSGGRSVLENIGPTDRRGLELSLQQSLGRQWTTAVAYTALDAKTLLPYTACAATPCSLVTVPAGSRLPAVPRNALYASAQWQDASGRFKAGAETVGRSALFADDRNLFSARGYWSTNLRAALTQQVAHTQVSETIRIDNVFDRRYVGTVIVNESNGRYFEPSPGRTVMAMFNVAYR